MLELAEVKKGDVLYDLGSGDGRIVIRAAKKYGVRAVGIEMDHISVDKKRGRTPRPPASAIWSSFAPKMHSKPISRGQRS